jgi:hypothetical protein
MTPLEKGVLKAVKTWARVNVAMIVSRDVTEEDVLAIARRHRIPVSTYGGSTWLIGKPSGRPVSLKGVDR